jgi:hypothetical protein
MITICISLDPEHGVFLAEVEKLLISHPLIELVFIKYSITHCRL